MTNVKHIAVREVCNPKSENVFRHAVPYNDLEHQKNWYAVESRIYDAIVEEKDGKQVITKTQNWFTNIMVFDIDIDAIHVGPVSEHQLEIISTNILKQLISLIGQPKCIIRNRNMYNQFQDERYFTVNGVVEHPKRWGYQVIYELDESIQSQMFERVDLYQKVRMHITRMVGADEGFRGHMHKNPLNTGLFKVEWCKNHKQLNICDLAVSLGVCSKEEVDAIWSLPPYERLEMESNPAVMKASSELAEWYSKLNQWKLPNVKANSGYHVSMNDIQDTGRNISMFNLLRSLPTSKFESAAQADILSEYPFVYDKCFNKDILDESEFESIKNSVINYRKRTGVEPVPMTVDKDLQVLPVQLVQHDNRISVKVADELKEAILAKKKNLFVDGEPYKLAGKVPVDKFDAPGVEAKLANAMIHIGAERMLCQCKNLVSQHVMDMLKEVFHLDGYGLYDMVGLVKRTVYMVHFAVVYAVRKARKGVKKKQHEVVKDVKLRDKYGVPYASQMEGKSASAVAYSMLPYVKMMIRDGLVGKDGSCKAVSFYQSKLKIRNQDASLLVKLIKLCLSIHNLIETKKQDNGKALTSISGNSVLSNHNIYLAVNDSLKVSIFIERFSIRKIYCNIYIFKLFVPCNSIMLAIPLTFDTYWKILLVFIPQLNFINLKESKIHQSVKINHMRRMHMNHLLFDVETTGFDYNKSFILSIGAILYNDEVDVTSEFYGLLNWLTVPAIKWNGTGAVDVHGITEEVLQNDPNSAPPLVTIERMKQWLSNFMDQVAPGGEPKQRSVQVLVAHNSSFDINMMRSNLMWLHNRYIGNDRPEEDLTEVTLNQKDSLDMILRLFTRNTSSAMLIDTLMFDRIFHFEEDGIKLHHDLEEIGNRYGFGANEKAHDALCDTRRLLKIYMKMLEEMNGKGIKLDAEFEQRLASKWKRERERYGKKAKEDYWGLEVLPLDV